MADLKIALLGLGKIGASMGLALGRYMNQGGKYSFERVGYDPRKHYTQPAQTMKAVDRVENQDFKAVQNADIVVMAMPYEDVKLTYERVVGDLRDGVVILDTSTLKKPSLQWATKILKDEHHLVGMTPVVNPAHLFDNRDLPETASAEMFDKGTVYLTPSVQAIKEAVDLAVNFSVILGGKPQFLDPMEHDVFAATMEQLPEALALALFYQVSTGETWTDVRRFTNPAFGALTRPLFDRHPDGMRDAWLHNHESLSRALDGMIDTLTQLRDVLKDEDRHSLEATLERGAGNYDRWINRRSNDKFDGDDGPDIDTGGGMMGALFGEGLSKRLFGKNKKD